MQSNYLFTFLYISSFSVQTQVILHTMAKLLSTSTSIQVESIVFPPSSKPPGATSTLVLGGAGVRGMEIQGKFVKLTGVGVYLEEKAIPSLASKWKCKSVEELENSIDFYTDIVTGRFEKHLQVTMIVPLSGKIYSEKVSETCVGFWKANGTYTDEDAKTIDKFLEVFKDQNFAPGSSILLTVSPAGSLTIGVSKDGVVPETANAVLENEKLGQAVIEMVIGKQGVSPDAKRSLASNVSILMN